MGVWRIYLALLLLLALQVTAVALAWPWRSGLIAGAAVGQVALLWFGYLGGGKARGWLRVFACVYVLWLLVMFVFVLGELASR